MSTAVPECNFEHTGVRSLSTLNQEKGKERGDVPFGILDGRTPGYNAEFHVYDTLDCRGVAGSENDTI
jgi:hypothetical protein